MVPVVGMELEPAQLGQAIRPRWIPTATLPFEASVDLHLDVFFHRPAAGSDGRRMSFLSLAEDPWDFLIVINPFAISKKASKPLRSR